jgi:ionotropic glutamate receptor
MFLLIKEQIDACRTNQVVILLLFRHGAQVFPKGSPMAPDVSRAIVLLTEGNEMALIERKWFGDPGACDIQYRGEGSSSLSFWSFIGLFLVTGVASGLMLIVYLATFVYRERNELRAAESEAGSMSLRRLRAWLQHYDRKDTRSPSFKRWNDGSMRNGVHAIRHTTPPSVSPFGGSGDSDMSAEASSAEEEVANAKCGQDILQADGEGRPSREACT